MNASQLVNKFELQYIYSFGELAKGVDGSCLQAYETLTQLIYDNEFQQGASRGTVEAMTRDVSQNWTLYLLNGDVSPPATI